MNPALADPEYLAFRASRWRAAAQAVTIDRRRMTMDHKALVVEMEDVAEACEAAAIYLSTREAK